MSRPNASGQGVGASAEPTGLSQVEPQEGLAPSGFDPSRMASLTVFEDGEGASYMWRHAIVAEILDRQERENAGRPDFSPAISRLMIERAISQLFGIYDCRPSDTAACYGWVGLWQALGVDFFASKFVFLSSDSDGSPEGGDSATGFVHDSAAPSGDRP